MTRRILVIAAHPDDEVLGCGATMARHAAAGDRVSVVIMAQGAASRSADRSATEEIAALRRAGETANGVLGVSHLEFCDFDDNRMDGHDRLDVVKRVEELVAAAAPDTIYTHHPGDLNVDHRRVAEAVMTACRPQPDRRVHGILFFEVPSSTEWQVPGLGSAFTPNHFVDVTATLEQKVEALRAYHDEMRPFPHARSYEAVRALAQWRGATVGCAAAEAFSVARTVHYAD